MHLEGLQVQDFFGILGIPQLFEVVQDLLASEVAIFDFVGRFENDRLFQVSEDGGHLALQDVLFGEYLEDLADEDLGRGFEKENDDHGGQNGSNLITASGQMVANLLEPDFG